jgi:hypothetical protein
VVVYFPARITHLAFRYYVCFVKKNKCQFFARGMVLSVISITYTIAKTVTDEMRTTENNYTACTPKPCLSTCTALQQPWLPCNWNIPTALATMQLEHLNSPGFHATGTS